VTGEGRLSLEELRRQVDGGGIDEVVLALVDLQGRLQGSRVGARHFLDSVVDHGFACCSYLLAVDADMATADGYAFSPSGSGFADFILRPDLATLRRHPWETATAYVLGDPHWADARPVELSPRQVLRRQLDRLADLGLSAWAATELEFVVFHESYAEARAAGYGGLHTATEHNVDYSLQGMHGLDPVARGIRSMARAAGLEVESARGECHPGQYEIVFRYDEALRTCDNHVLYKTGAKHVAAENGVALTFMAKYDQGEGSSGHVHFSLRSVEGEPVMAETGTGDGTALSTVMEHFLAGQLACLPELTLAFAPNVNSYKRLQPGAFAPTFVSWGRDNRTAAVRVVGAGPSLRIEHRVPGADVNPYVAVAAIIAAGLHGIEHQLVAPPPCAGDARAGRGARIPGNLGDAVERWEASKVAVAAFGADVVDHLAGAARAELAAFDGAVTDWERRRGFERL
jgi:glutamine synthetase